MKIKSKRKTKQSSPSIRKEKVRWGRSIHASFTLIVPNSELNSISKKLKNLELKALKSKAINFIYSTRHKYSEYSLIDYQIVPPATSEFYPPKIDKKTQFLLGVDPNSVICSKEGNKRSRKAFKAKTRFYKEGNERVGELFKSNISLTVGFLIQEADKSKLLKNPKAKKLIKNITNAGEEIGAMELWGICCNVELNSETSELTAEIMGNLKSLQSILKKLKLAHKVSFFDNGYGIVKCDYDDIVDDAIFEEEFNIGPSAIPSARG